MELYYQTSDSLTLSIYVNGVLTDADATPTITITRLSDSVVIVDNATVTAVSTGKYKYTLSTSNNSTIGQYKAEWNYTVSSVANIKTDYYDVIVGYTNATRVRELFPDLSTKTNDEIYAKEKLARRIIDAYTNQTFGFEENVTRIYNGDNSSKLYLDRRLYNLDEVLLEGTDDITAELEVLDDYWLRPIADIRPGFFIEVKKGLTEPSRYFRKQVKYHVKGDWGWESVPETISLAAAMLINDYFCDTSMLREHGILSYELGDKDITFRRDLWGTTGNYNVDMILSEFTFVGVELF